MLGKTANGLFWMARYIERAENVARLIEAGWRMSLVRADRAETEWAAIATSAGVFALYAERHGEDHGASQVIDFLLRDPTNPSSAANAIEAARTNARMVRTAITREVWEAINDFWLDLGQRLKRPVGERQLGEVLEGLRRHGALVRGATYGTMLRNEIFDFMRIGTYLERGDATASILDVKYHVLLPRTEDVGGPLDVAQWEQILRSVQVNRAYMMEYGSEYRADCVAEFLMLNERMPRSLRFCARRVAEHLDHLAGEYGERSDACEAATALARDMDGWSLDEVFRDGLHGALTGFISRNGDIAERIGRTYRFVG